MIFTFRGLIYAKKMTVKNDRKNDRKKMTVKNDRKFYTVKI
jgi:DNA-binding CsgD family transcriptional regulator